jgi:plasmid replication initiation protein
VYLQKSRLQIFVVGFLIAYLYCQTKHTTMTNLHDLVMTYKKRSNNYQSNLITKSKQQFTLQEQRVVAFIINQLDHTKDYQKEYNGKDIIFNIPVSELSPYLPYNEIKKISRTLSDKKIIIVDDDELEEHDFITPFPRVSYKKRILTIKMLSDVVPYFIELGKEYTKYHLETFLSLSSVFSQKMYQIIMMYWGRGQKKFTYNVVNLQGVLNSNCRDYYDFKRIVLEVSRKEIEEKCGMIFSYEPSRKEGKKVVELLFIVKSALEIEFELQGESIDAWKNDFLRLTPTQQYDITKDLLEKTYTFSKKQQNEILQSDEMISLFIKLHIEIQEGKHEIKKTPTAYIASCLGFNKKKMLK